MLIDEAFLEILNKPTFWGFIQLLGPVWIAFFLGVMAGWAWKPRRDVLGNYKFEFSLPSSPYSASIQNSNVNSPMLSNRFRQNSNRLNVKPLALSKGFRQNSNVLNVNSPMLSNGFGQNSNMFNANSPMLSNEFGQNSNGLNLNSPVLSNGFGQTDDDDGCSPSKLGKDETSQVTNEDLEHFSLLVERRDGGPTWKHIMDRSTHGMSYQAWQRDPEGGPPQYCSRTVYEDATPEMLRDFFWDDEFRLNWDDMIVGSTVLEECPTTGTMVVHWTRKFPFFCSDREYIVARRIWESGRSYYCVTKGVPCLSVPRRDKPRRVDLFYSSWFIQAVESSKGDACEVILFHYEDMGISHGITKFGVRQGMWGAVKSVERGFRAYQAHRASGGDLSHYALFAQINTKLDPNYSRSRILEDGDGEGSSSGTNSKTLARDEKPNGGMNLPKILVMGGALTMAFNLDRGLLMKMIIFGVVRKLGNIGRRE